jgi:hypothetical protein
MNHHQPRSYLGSGTATTLSASSSCGKPIRRQHGPQRRQGLSPRRISPIIDHIAGTFEQPRHISSIVGCMYVVNGYPLVSSRECFSLRDSKTGSPRSDESKDQPYAVDDDSVLAVASVQKPVWLIDPKYQLIELYIVHGRSFGDV